MQISGSTCYEKEKAVTLGLSSEKKRDQRQCKTKEKNKQTHDIAGQNRNPRMSKQRNDF